MLKPRFASIPNLKDLNIIKLYWASFCAYKSVFKFCEIFSWNFINKDASFFKLSVQTSSLVNLITLLAVTSLDCSLKSKRPTQNVFKSLCARSIWDNYFVDRWKLPVRKYTLEKMLLLDGKIHWCLKVNRKRKAWN